MKCSSPLASLRRSYFGQFAGHFHADADRAAGHVGERQFFQVQHFQSVNIGAGLDGAFAASCLAVSMASVAAGSFVGEHPIGFAADLRNRSANRVGDTGIFRNDDLRDAGNILD